MRDGDYDEFGFLEETAKEWGLPWRGAPRVARRDALVAAGQQLSALVWGDAPPDLVFLHGGGQNAHTWDAVVLALGRPAIAFDLPGHGRSSWRADRDYWPWSNAAALEVALAQLAPGVRPVLVGMSLGGATAIRLAATRPDLVRKAVIIDVTPQGEATSRELSRAERGAVALVAGPQSYDSFEAMVEAAVALSPRRSPASVRRGVRHNAKRQPDGRWAWRYDLFGSAAPGDRPRVPADLVKLWDDVSRIGSPAMLVRGGASKFVTDADVAEMRRRLPGLRVEVVPESGHSVQSDAPLELTRLIEDFAFGDPRA